MDQQSHQQQDSSLGFINTVNNNMEEGEVVEIKQKIQKVKLSKNGRCEIQGSDSQWSWDSIQDLKGIDLKNMQAEEQNNQRMEPAEHRQQPKLKVVFPEKPTNIQALTIKYVGNVLSKVGDLLIVTADLKQGYQVVDLDGWVCNQQKQFIGFVIDVFGKIQSPYYAIKPQQQITNLDSFIGKQIFYIQGTKVLKQDQIKSIQSKNKCQLQVQQSQSSQQEKQERQMSVQNVPQIYKEYRNNQGQGGNNIDERRNRKKSFDHGDRNNQRSRTREHFRNRNNNNQNRQWNNNHMRQNNQQYLQNMYAMHYAQMMQFYNPNYQPNTANLQMPPNFMAPPPPFIQGNQPPTRPNNFVMGNQPFVNNNNNGYQNNQQRGPNHQNYQNQNNQNKNFKK